MSAEPNGEALRPVIFRPSITMHTDDLRCVVEVRPNTYGLFSGQPGGMVQQGYLASYDKVVGRARDIVAGRWPSNLQDALVTMAVMIVVIDALTRDPQPSEYVALAVADKSEAEE